jgi:hypothetical protein
MDQIIAQETGKETQLPSLELAMESADTAGACDTGFACAYTNTLCWKSANTPLPMQNDPRIIFERMFGDSDSTDPKARLARFRQQKSVLDSVREEMARLEGALPPGDRTKLAEYLDAVRGVEKRIQIAEQQNSQQLPVVKNPGGVPASWEDHLKLMFDLEVLAFQCDLTRVITFMLGREHSGMTFPQIGVPDAHHPISHHQLEPEKVAKVVKINAYHVQMFAYLLDRLRSTPDGDGTLLEHVTLLYGAGMADSNSHSPINLPLILAGGGAGHLKGGRHIRFKGEPLANLHLTLMEHLGVHCDRIGGSTEKIDARLLSLS